MDDFILISIPKKPLNHSYDIKTSLKIGISYFCSISSLILKQFRSTFKVYVEILVEILILIKNKIQFWKINVGLANVTWFSMSDQFMFTSFMF